MQIFLNKYLTNLKFKLFLSLIFSIVFAMLSLFSTLIFSFVIDYVISGNVKETFILKIIKAFINDPSILRNKLFLVSIIIIVIELFCLIAIYLRDYLKSVVAENMAMKIRNDFFVHISRLEYQSISKIKTGDLIQRATTDIEMIHDFFNNQIQEIVYAVFNSLIAIGILFTINIKMSLISFIGIVIIFFYSYKFNIKIQQQFLKSDEAEGAMGDFVSEALGGERIIKAYNMEKYEINKFDRLNKKYHDITKVCIYYLGNYWSFSYCLILAINLLIILVGLIEAKNNNISIGNLFVFMAYQMYMLFPIRNLGKILSDAGKMSVSINRLNEIFNLPIEDYYSGQKFSFNREIEFKDVSFAYDHHQKILDNLSFKLEKGKKLAIFGKVGSGKSTIAYLLNGLLKADEGQILIDDIDIKNINISELRTNISLVLQEPFLFSKTIKENVMIAGDETNIEHMHKVLETVMMTRTINEFKNAHDTLIGEKGITLSGGQKQRLAISRNLLANPKIVIFDDSFNALDNKTEISIRNNLAKINDLTTIIITQRINIAKECDQIMVIEDGKISAFGSHDELIKQDGLYRNIYHLQSQVVKDV